MQSQAQIHKESYALETNVHTHRWAKKIAPQILVPILEPLLNYPSKIDSHLQFIYHL